jgi:hypothetical protein
MSYIGQQLPADVFSGFVTDSFTGDGSATTFTLSKAPFSEDALIVVINNVIQKPVTNFTVSGTTLTIVGTAVASGDVIYAMHTSGAVPSTLASKVDVNGLSDGVILDADADTTISADTDDQIDFKAGGTDIMSLTATTATINDGVTISVADNTDTLTLKSTDTDASSGPVLLFNRDSASPAANDFLGTIDFQGDNSAGDAHDYIRILSRILSTTDGSEKANLIIKGADGNNLVDFNSDEGTVFNEDSLDLNFRIESNGNANMFKVDAGSNLVLIGTGTDRLSAPLQVSGSGHNTAVGTFTHTGDNSGSGNPYGVYIEFSGSAPDDTGSTFLTCYDTGATRLQIQAQGNVQNHDNSYGQISDERIKQNITDANSQWDDIKALKVKNFERKDDVAAHGEGKSVQIGLIAQECETVSPGLIDEQDPSAGDIKVASEFGELNEDGTIKSTTGEKVKAIKYSVLYMKAIKALQEAMAKIETLETKVKALEDA